MLSSLLRSLKKLAVYNRISVELPDEIMMALSFIESGCLAVSLNNKTVFVFKGLSNELESLKKTKSLQFGLDCIKRPEFPSVRIYFDFRDKSNKPYLFDYFFNMESDEEMKLLKKFEEQDYFDILFFDSRIVYSRRIQLTKKDKEKIKETLDETEI
ncbi:MAG: hypothetical protein L0Y68_04350 [Candidatus Dadabacteria bacterium]|nr:hypothetical protein [Candidatus Dadabacteria bacterium]